MQQHQLCLNRAIVLALALSCCWKAFASDEIEGDKAEETEASPEEVLSGFVHSIVDDQYSKAQELLFTPIKNPQFATRVDEILGLLAQQYKNARSHRVFDSNATEDLAIVVYGIESSGYRDNIKIGHVFLRKQSSQWRILLANTIDDLKSHELAGSPLNEDVDKLVEWFEKRELEIRNDWRKQTDFTVNGVQRVSLEELPAAMVGRRRALIVASVREDGALAVIGGKYREDASLDIKNDGVAGTLPSGEEVDFGNVVAIHRLQRNDETRYEVLLDGGTSIQIYEDRFPSAGKKGSPIWVAMIAPEKGGKLKWMLEKMLKEAD